MYILILSISGHLCSCICIFTSMGSTFNLPRSAMRKSISSFFVVVIKDYTGYIPGANIQYKSHSTKRKTTYSIFLSDIFRLIPFLRIKLPTYSVFHNWRADFGNDKGHQHTLGESMYQSLRFPNLLFIKLTFFSIYDTISSILS